MNNTVYELRVAGEDFQSVNTFQDYNLAVFHFADEVVFSNNRPTYVSLWERRDDGVGTMLVSWGRK